MRGIIVDLYNRVIDLMANRITSVRAALLDHLDADISSRAAAASALSTAQWTNALASALASLAASTPIATCINSKQEGYVNVDSSTWSTGSGEDAAYTDVTITSVNASKAVVTWQSSCAHFNGSDGGLFVGGTARLTSATNLRIAIQELWSGNVPIRGRWIVTEFK